MRNNSIYIFREKFDLRKDIRDQCQTDSMHPLKYSTIDGGDNYRLMTVLIIDS